MLLATFVIVPVRAGPIFVEIKHENDNEKENPLYLNSIRRYKDDTHSILYIRDKCHIKLAQMAIYSYH